MKKSFEQMPNQAENVEDQIELDEQEKEAVQTIMETIKGKMSITEDQEKRILEKIKDKVDTGVWLKWGATGSASIVALAIGGESSSTAWISGGAAGLVVFLAESIGVMSDLPEKVGDAAKSVGKLPIKFYNRYAQGVEERREGKSHY